MTTTLPSPTGTGSIRLRPIEPPDHDEVARILFAAFGDIHDRHAFPRDFPTLEAARGLVEAFTANPRIWAVLAERDGRILGSNFLDDRADVVGVGPITVAPGAQGSGVGRLLMHAALDRGADRADIRLFQDSFNTASLGLYASLGFSVAEPAVVVGGRPRSRASGAAAVRPLVEADLAGCTTLCREVLGYDRTVELRDALGTPGLAPTVAERDGTVVAYATTLTAGFPLTYAVARSAPDLTDLIAGTLAGTGADASFLLPTRQHAVFRWCLDAGLRVVKPMTYMTVGDYRPPSGAWLPSVLH